MVDVPSQISRIDGYTVGKTLGSGFSAKVKLVTDQAGEQYAMKIFKLGTPQFDEKAFKLLKEEVEATQHLDHKNVVHYREFKENAQWHKKDGSVINVAYIVQELIQNGELFDYVANTGPFEVKYCKYFFKQMLQGLNYIHSKGFSHRDLKPENILLNKDFSIKIVDFGFSCPLEGRDGSGTNKSVVGTPGYMAPEIFLKQPYQGQVVDLFALGVILFIMYTGHPPFAMANEKDNHYKLLATNRSDLFWKAHQQRKAENFFSEEFKNLITCMLQFHPHQRLCIADIIGHPWLQSGGIATVEEVLEEFNRRHEVNKKRAEEEHERKDHQRNQVNRGPHRDLNVGGKVFLSHNDPVKQGQDPANVVRLQLKEMDMSMSHRYAFFSEFAPDVLMEQLTQKLEENSQVFEMSDKTWKLVFKVEKQINEFNDDADDDEEEQAESYIERATVQVQVLKVPEQNKYCVEFQRKGGSAILFYNHANKYIDLLELCNNTRLDETPDNAVAQQ